MKNNKTGKNIDTARELLLSILQLKEGAEIRPQQEQAVDEINEALKQHSNLVLESPTGSGKTLSYMIPLIFNETHAVVSTATKQLSEQIVNIDIPFLEKAVKEINPAMSFQSALLKGRENYYCLAKENDSKILDEEVNSMFILDDEPDQNSGSSKIATEIKQLKDWADRTKTGDRSEAPAVSDKVWRQFSSNSTECPGRKLCPFAKNCFSEKAREKAKDADIVITNHAVVAHDLIQEENSLLGDRETYVFDELHELDDYLTNAWGVSLSAKQLKDGTKTFKSLPAVSRKDVEEFDTLARKFNPTLKNVDAGLLTSTPNALEDLLNRLYNVTGRISIVADKQANDKDSGEGVRKIASAVAKKATEISEAAAMLNDDHYSIVRWVKENDETNDKTMYAAPLRNGPKLQEALSSKEANMVGISATIRVQGSFEIPVHNLALDESSTAFKTVALSSPFDYPKQAMIYIPKPEDFPAPVGKERKEHSEAVSELLAEEVEAMGGRTLALFTTAYAASFNAKFLRKRFPKMTILAQGDAPLSQLVDEFKTNERSVLVATMGMWHGLDVVGASLSNVFIDKIPFPPMDDPLSLARQNWSAENGRNGFMDVCVAEANIKLAQGVGRAIRSKSDKAVITIADVRLRTKPYGKAMLKSLPDAKIFGDKDKVLAAMNRLRKMIENQ